MSADVEAVTVERLNGMIDGGTSQDPMGDVAMDVFSLAAFDGMYVEVGSMLVVDHSGLAILDCTSGFGLSDNSSSLSGILTRTGDLSISCFPMNPDLSEITVTFHVVPKASDAQVSYKALGENIRSFEYQGYSTDSITVCTRVGQYTEVDAFVGSSDGSASLYSHVKGNMSLNVGSNGLLYGTPTSPGVTTYSMLETDDAVEFYCTVIAFEEYEYSAEFDNGGGVGGPQSVGLRGFTIGDDVHIGTDIDPPTLQGYEFVDYSDEDGRNIGYGRGLSYITLQPGIPTRLTAVWERSFSELEFLSDPSDGVISYV